MSSSPPPDLSLEEYKMVVDHIRDESREYWTRFNSMFVINAALIAAVGFFIGSPDKTALSLSTLTLDEAIVVVSVVGFTVSTVWLFISFRAEAFQSIWTNRAKAIENRQRSGNPTFPQIYTEMSKSFDKMGWFNSYKRVPILSAPFVVAVMFMIVFWILPQILTSQMLVVLSNNIPLATWSFVVDFAVLIIFVVWGLEQKWYYSYHAC